jgi:ribosomal protein L16 Arg81 hydroxylase
MGYSFLNKKEFLTNRENKEYYFFGNVDIDLLSWEDIILELEYHIQNHKRYEPRNNLHFILLEPTHPTIVNVLNEYSKLNPTFPSAAHCYMTLLTRSGGGNGKHKDIADVIFWQVVGKTHWTIETKQGTREHILLPGDAIYVPANMWHHVISLTPRAGISFGLDHAKLIPQNI